MDATHQHPFCQAEFTSHHARRVDSGPLPTGRGPWEPRRNTTRRGEHQSYRQKTPSVSRAPQSGDRTSALRSPQRPPIAARTNWSPFNER
jgi:hypothetical protein